MSIQKATPSVNANDAPATTPPAENLVNPPISRARARVIALLAEARNQALALASVEAIERPLRQVDLILANVPKPPPKGQTMAEIWADIAQVPPGLPAHPALQGVQPRIEYQPGLSIIAAPTSAGKTTLMVAQVVEWLLDPTSTGKILFWSAETPRTKLWAKIFAAQAKMTMWDVIHEIKQAPSRQGAVAASLERTRQALDAATERLVIMDEDATGVELLAMADRIVADSDGLLAVVIDYIQELPAVPDTHPWADRLSRNRELEIGYLARQLRQWGMRNGVPVVAAAQFNRTVSDANDWVPDLLQLRESGRLEQNAALVLGLRNETMSGAQRTGQNNGGVAPTKTYHAWDADEMEVARQGAMYSVGWEHPDEEGWILLEAFVLKNREYGGVGTVVPMALNERWGRVEPLNARITVYAGTVVKRRAAAKRKQGAVPEQQQEVSDDGDTEEDEYFAPR
ncbi:DnaB-like helicase C-terminal domain-containing protein [Sulfobacillus harzensis]|uniref:AAA family ATPase n=1 Tax=Sulfobacillus harzensis TaxID=2729629 RepID=A0A7Y0L498_9FIRM|nr:DnaB-like helicase C-terminal domain-containing protein [Sulfobacillus harzensis]NMP23031.1 AAA family ATPase [Sulfobacillus harzensis]